PPTCTVSDKLRYTIICVLFVIATAPPAIYTLSLHDALPISEIVYALGAGDTLVGVDSTSIYPRKADALPDVGYVRQLAAEGLLSDRKSTRLNSSHVKISYAVFCLKKKKYQTTRTVQ